MACSVTWYRAKPEEQQRGFSNNKCQAYDREKDTGRHQRRGPRCPQMNGGDLGSRRQVVSFRLAKNQKKRVCSANARPMGIVDARILVATLAQFLQTLPGLLLQFIEFAKVN